MADLKKKAAKLSAVDDARRKAEAIVNKKPASKKKKDKDKKEKKKGNAVVRYLKEMRSELKKVVWPSRKKVINNTFVVLVALVVFGISLWGVDTGFAALFKVLISGFGA
ncbi:MAG: preprotein translocase subunit SecE [Ruminococcus sp.]|jgi:preprotein translocase subunit SecE|nr:preprotein translocase subunit SecE [Ruminococcus sp.]